MTVVEVQSQLRASGQVMLDGNGNGVITFDTNSANQRWQVTSIMVKTNQPANATAVPVATVALNTADVTTMSDGNNRGASWSGNQDTFAGLIDVGPCDFLSVIFSPAPGTSAVVTAAGPATYPSLMTWPGTSVYPGGGTGLAVMTLVGSYPEPSLDPSPALFPGYVSVTTTTPGGGTITGGSALAGVICSAVVLGTKYTFRGYS